MLQQTRVVAVIPYYERFVRRFPTVQTLARAKMETVLEYWAGLGYYSRARNMHAAAKQIVARHGGRFPRQLDDALELPGIGRYTAAAILSIAFNEPLAVLDGNVARVLARLGAVRGDLRAPKRWGELERAASALLALREAGDWNQAMMELGATVCTPLLPRCDACHVEYACRARALGIEDDLPAKRSKRAVVSVTLAAAVLLDPQGRTMLVRPTAGGTRSEAQTLFSGLWQFPAVIVSENPRAEIAKVIRGLYGLKGAGLKLEMRPLALARHTVTFRRIKLASFLVPVMTLPAVKGASARIASLTDVGKVAVSSATRKIAAAANMDFVRPASSRRIPKKILRK